VKKNAFVPPDLPHFDGFPHLVTRIVAALYHIILVPAGLPRTKYLDLLARQRQANQLTTGLALGDSTAWYGGEIVTGKLEPSEVFSPTPELLARRARLDRFVTSHNSGGYLFGDLTKGGHPATPEEREALAGHQTSGAPTGLDPCIECGEWRGRCLDPNPRFSGLVMCVHCRCENHTLCALCGVELADHRLNANYYYEDDGNIWHVPGFSGLSHRCSARQAGSSPTCQRQPDPGTVHGGGR
jgi:hypothetical protein